MRRGWWQAAREVVKRRARRPRTHSALPPTMISIVAHIGLLVVQAISTLHKKGLAELLALEELDLKEMTTDMPIWDGLGGLMQIGKLKKLGLVRSL